MLSRVKSRISHRELAAGWLTHNFIIGSEAFSSSRLYSTVLETAQLLKEGWKHFLLVVHVLKMKIVDASQTMKEENRLKRYGEQMISPRKKRAENLRREIRNSWDLIWKFDSERRLFILVGEGKKESTSWVECAGVAKKRQENGLFLLMTRQWPLNMRKLNLFLCSELLQFAILLPDIRTNTRTPKQRDRNDKYTGESSRVTKIFPWPLKTSQMYKLACIDWHFTAFYAAATFSQPPK